MEHYVKEFEQTVMDLKQPYLDITDKNNNQNVEAVLGGVGKKLNELYRIIYTYINNNGAQENNASLGESNIYSVFEQKGLFTALRNNPDLKEQYERSLKLILQEYPYTPNTRHINELRDTATTPDRMLVPNLNSK
jgi:hypothetical protein